MYMNTSMSFFPASPLRYFKYSLRSLCVVFVLGLVSLYLGTYGGGHMERQDIIKRDMPGSNELKRDMRRLGMLGRDILGHRGHEQSYSENEQGEIDLNLKELTHLKSQRLFVHWNTMMRSSVSPVKIPLKKAGPLDVHNDMQVSTASPHPEKSMNISDEHAYQKTDNQNNTSQIQSYEDLRKKMINDSQCDELLQMSGPFTHVATPGDRMLPKFKMASLKLDFDISGSDICDDFTETVVMVMTTHENVALREAIRQTYGSVAKGHPWPHREITGEYIKVVFVVGRHKRAKKNQLLIKESFLHGDIIQGTFSDSNHTMKVLLAMQWTVTFCKGARYLVKSQDDIFLNLPYITRFLNDLDTYRTIITDFSSYTPIGEKELDRLHLLLKVNISPPIPNSPVYIITRDLLKELLSAAEYFPAKLTPDLYVCGILGEVVGAKHMSLPGFSRYEECPPLLCDVIQEIIISARMITPKSMLTLWHDLNFNTVC